MATKYPRIELRALVSTVDIKTNWAIKADHFPILVTEKPFS